MRRFVLALLPLIAACSQQSDSAPQLPPVQRASTGPDTPDGRYYGQLVATGSVGGPVDMCGSMDRFELDIRNGKFRFTLSQPSVPYRRRIVFDATVGPDGSFATPPGPTYMKGFVTLGHMQGQVVGDACNFDLQADRTGTW